MAEIPRVRTPLRDEELREALREALRTVCGAEPSPTRLSLLWAVLALEHGAGADGHAPPDGRAGWNIWCHDVGNRRGGGGDAGWFRMTAVERQHGHDVPLPGRWPAFSSAAAGMESWLRLLEDHYSRAWDASDDGYAVPYARAAYAGGYFTASPDTYAAGLSTWLRIYWRRWPRQS